MRRDRVSGWAMIAGSLGAVVTMVLHPVGGSLREDLDHLTRIANVGEAVHVLAIVAICVQAFGYWGLGRALGFDSGRVRAGMIAFVLAWVTCIGAATASGILSADLIAAYPEAGADERSALDAIWHYNFMVNQALDRFIVGGFVVGMLLWSWSMLGHGTRWRAVGVLGLAIGAVAFVLLVTGRMRFDVTQFGLFVFAESLWAVLCGTFLLIGSREPSA